MFGNNNHIFKPNGLIIENYTKRQNEFNQASDYPQHIKSFVNPRKTIPSYINPHYFLYDPIKSFPYIPACVNENFKTINFDFFYSISNMNFFFRFHGNAFL